MRTQLLNVAHDVRPGPLGWVRRATIERTPIYVRRMWVSRCGRYRISEFRRVVEGHLVYYSERSWRREDGRVCWDVLRRHYSYTAAVNTCCRHAREGSLE